LRDEDLERITAAAHARARRARPGASNHGEAHFDAVRDEWDDLAAETKNIFATWEWAATWWRHFGGADRRLLITPVREGGQTVAILPLYLSTTRPLRTIRFIGHGPSDQLGPVCASVDLPRAADAFRNVLRDTEPRWDVFRGDDIPTEWSRLLNGHLVASVASPLIRFNSETWDGFLATLSSRFRHEIRHDQRALERLHSVRFRLASSASLGADLDTLFKLHAARWRRSDFLLRNQEFHREFARRALDRGWLRLWFLEIDGSPVAVWYGFRFEGVEFHYQAGRDPTWTKYSVGLVLLSHTIRQALEDGITEYRFLRGAESYKYRFTNEESEVDTIVLSRTIPGKAAEAAWRLQRTAVHTVEQHERSRAVAARSRAAIAKARDRWLQ
jgi:CelD/BcsL family acetyltransferase involved in cellulose biosynthesis